MYARLNVCPLRGWRGSLRLVQKGLSSIPKWQNKTECELCLQSVLVVFHQHFRKTVCKKRSPIFKKEEGFIIS